MGLFKFGNKEKKTKEAINATKKQIITVISTALLSCKDGGTATVLRNIQTQLQSQGETSDERALATDTEILQLVSEANTYILKQQYTTASAKLNKALNKVIDRSQYCIAGGQMTKQDKAAAEAAAKLMSKVAANTTKTREEQLQEQLDQKNAEYEGLQKELAQLQELGAADPYNDALIARYETTQDKIADVKYEIDEIKSELSFERVSNSMETRAKVSDNVVQGRRTDAEIQVTQSKLEAQIEERRAASEQEAAMREVLNRSRGATQSNATAQSTPFLRNDAAAQSSPFLRNNGAAAAQNSPFLRNNGATAQTSPFVQNQQNTQYGGFNASGIGTADMARDIIKTKKALEDEIDAFSDKIDDANDELNDYNAQLRPLLERRKTASPSDCLVLDGQIDQINAKRNSVKNKIMRYRQVVSQLSDKLSLIDKLDTQQDLESANKSIEQLTGGRFSDFQGLAMYLNDSIKQSNEQLEEIGSAVSVSESEDIMMNSFSGSQASLNDATVVKDEEKYDNVMQELGMTF